MKDRRWAWCDRCETHNEIGFRHSCAKVLAARADLQLVIPETVTTYGAPAPEDTAAVSGRGDRG